VGLVPGVVIDPWYAGNMSWRARSGRDGRVIPLDTGQQRLLLLLVLLPIMMAAAGSAAGGGGGKAMASVGDEFDVPAAAGGGVCSAKVMGCFFDKKWGDCRYLPSADAKCTQPPSYKQGRDIPYFLPGCFDDPDNAGETAPDPPACDKATITLKTCAAKCAAWAPRIPGVGQGAELYAAVQAGYACACGSSHAGAAAMATDSTNALPWSACDNKCPGDPEQMCGGGSRNTLVRIECGSDWGLTFMVVFVVGIGAYVSGGVLYGAKIQGQGQSCVLRSHPHWGVWLELRSLVIDGVEFSRRGGTGVGHRNQVLADEQHRHLLGGRPSEGRSKNSSRRASGGRGDGGGGHSRKASNKAAGSMRKSGKGSAPLAKSAASSPLTGPTGGTTPAGGGGRWVQVPS
jgi:hypothetical protein